MNSIFWNRKIIVDRRQKLKSEKILVYVQKPRLKIPFQNSISDHGPTD